MDNSKSILYVVILAFIIFTLACSTSTVIPHTASATPASTTVYAPALATSVLIVPTSTSATITNGDTVVIIQGVKLQITSATRQASYKNPITQKEYTPDNTQQNEVMVVEAKVISGNIEIVSDWRDVWITDENGRETSPGSVTTMADGTVIWPIVVQKSSHSFTLHLPDGVTVELDSLVK